MKYKRLGRSGLHVSEVCFGVMTFTGRNGWTHLGAMEQREANRLTAIALESGVNFFDTADVYSSGNSETMLAKALGKKRPEVVIATKVGFRMKEGINGDGHSRKRIIEACDASLKRLQTDYIDLYQIHAYDFTTPFEEFLSALDYLVGQGKVRYIGASNFFAWQLMKACALSDRNGWSRFVSLQAYYSLLGRDLEYELVPVCADQGLGILIWSPLHSGLLTGKYRKGKAWPKNTRLKVAGDYPPYETESAEVIFDTVEAIARRHRVSTSRIALSYLLHKPCITSVVIGARNEKQLRDNIGASAVVLSEDDMRQLNEVSAPRRIYPYWYFDQFRQEGIERFLKVLQEDRD
jgi:aryl-alcohol dehydrogenase-like predicted oxidoreductase